MTEKQNNDKETISRLREALANMNKDYMQTKLELDQMKGCPSSSSPETAITQKPDLGAQLLKFSSKIKAFQSNVNTKLATAGIQINNKDEDDINNNNITNHDEEKDGDNNINNNNNNNNKEIRRLRDDIEGLQYELKEKQKILKNSMIENDDLEKEKNQYKKERNELLIKYGSAEEEIKRLKQQSINDSNRYEQLLDSFRAENSSQIEIEKKKLYKECDDKINALNRSCQENKEKYDKLTIKWDGNEESWNNKFDLVVTERNSLKRKVKSLQNDLSEYINKNNKNNNNNNNNHDIINKFEEEEEVKMDNKKIAEIAALKTEIIEIKKVHQNEKTSLLNSIQRLSSKSRVQSKGSDMQFLVNSLSNLISEKEDIITSLTQSKKFLGHRLLELEKQLNQIKK